MLRQPRVFTERQKSCNLSKKKRKSHIISGWGFFLTDVTILNILCVKRLCVKGADISWLMCLDVASFLPLFCLSFLLHALLNAASSAEVWAQTGGAEGMENVCVCEGEQGLCSQIVTQTLPLMTLTRFGPMFYTQTGTSGSWRNIWLFLPHKVSSRAGVSNSFQFRGHIQPN